MSGQEQVSVMAVLRARVGRLWRGGRKTALVAAVVGTVVLPQVASASRPAVDAAAASGQVAEAGVEVERAVARQVAADGAADFWVVFDEQADLSGADEVDRWGARGRYVHGRLVATAEASQRGLAAQLSDDGVEFESLWIVNAMLVRGGDQATLDVVTSAENVAQVRAPRSFELPDPVQPESQGTADATVDAVEWGIADIGADRVWEEFGARGQGIVVGNIDTGVQFEHPALDDQYRGNQTGGTVDHDYNWWDPSQVCGNPSLAPCDNNGHGTHTMGTMVGDDGGDNQVGVAPQAEWVAAKGCETNACSEFALVSSGQFMLAPTDLDGENPRPELRPHIVNNSWGDAGGDDFYDEVIARWVDAGMFPVFSNGNDGPACGSAGSPADGPDAYAVGAYDSDNEIASFSSRGPGRDDQIRPHIAAPGVDVRSSFPDGQYATGDGTSMAAPHVAGTVALMWSAAPELVRDVEATKALLDAVAVDTDDTTCGGTAANNNVYGEGRLDAFAAVDNAAIGPVPEVTITEPADGAVVTEGDPVTFTGTAVDFEGADLSAGLDWASSLDGTLGSGASLTTTTLSLGTHTITAAAVDEPGRTGVAQLTVHVVVRIEAWAESWTVRGRRDTQREVDLFWSGATTYHVDVYRDDTHIATVENSGYHLDSIGGRGRATHTYRICETDVAVPACSDEVTARFGAQIDKTSVRSLW